jgi:hypothetical protein
VVVRWSARSPDGARLTSVVEYSPDSGRHWDLVAAGLPGNSVRLDSRFLSASGDARLRVLVSDGFNQTIATSGRLRSRGAPPTVEILQGPRSARVRQTDTLLLEGDAFDDSDRAITGRRLRWYLGRRLIGTGEQVTASNLPAGAAYLRLVATDSHGRSAQVRFPLRVTAVPAHLLVFEAPLLLPSRAVRVRILVAASELAKLRIAGRSYRVGPHLRTITVRIRPGHGVLRLRVSLRSAGGVVNDTYAALRR